MPKSFSEAFEGMSPKLEVVAPGRVNLIGEHVDHQKYAVLPCCIENAIKIEVFHAPKKTDCCPALEVHHDNEARYSSKKFQSVSDIKVCEPHHWTNYIVACYLGIVEMFALQNVDSVGHNIEPKKGLTSDIISKAEANSPDRCPTKRTYRMFVSGNVPTGAGLSSSSALVIAVSQALDTGFSVHSLASICANAERYVGTAGGGMDQAAISLCKEGAASHIKFAPLRVSAVDLPRETALVIANTCKEAPKVRDAAKMYNMRVFELKVASVKLLQALDKEMAKMDVTALLNLGLRDVVEKWGVDEKGMLEKLASVLPDKPMTRAECDEILGEDLRNALLDRRCGRGVWEQNEAFYPGRRVRHVLAEAIRVEDFVNTCRANVKEGVRTPDEVVRKLGELMNQSHYSLRDDFDCSCTELNELTSIARKAPGAIGSRLTGAGWGGCTVSLVDADKTTEFIEYVKKEYFAPKMTPDYKGDSLEYLPKTEAELEDVIFATKPSAAVRVRQI